MEVPVLNATYRIGVGKNSAKRARNIGQVPGVIYDEALNKLIGIEQRELDTVLNQYGQNAVVEVKIGEDRIKSVIAEVQHDPINRQVVHIDFKPVNERSKVRAHIPVKFIGTEDAERIGGIIQKQKQEIEVECTADSVPKYITADLSQLNVGQSFKVQDIEIAEELTILTKPIEVLATLTAPANYSVTSEQGTAGNEGEK